MKNRDELLQKVNESRFAVDEAVLFLDTHPNCDEAYQYLKEASHKSRQAIHEYEEQCGPLFAFHTDACSYQWINDPWPWQKGGC